MKRKTHLLLAAVASLSWLAAACTEGDASADSDHHTQAGHEADAVERPQVTFRAGNDVIELPDEVPSGYVDIRVEALENGEAHLAFGRLVDGVTFEEISAADPGASLDEMVTDVVGNGTVFPGGSVLLTAKLVPGEWVALNIYFDGGDIPQFAFDRFTVVDEGNDAPPPDEDGTIVLGPGMRIDVDGQFDASGVWKVENHDEEQMHEPAVVGLTAGSTGEDLIAALADAQGPPPIRGEFGGMGALSPGNEAWVTFEDPLEPGNYSLICWVPDVNGVPHLMSGMFQDFTVS
jgi:hypothetical protein